MQEYYIQPPTIKPNVTVSKCKAPRYRRAKIDEVPLEYRKRKSTHFQDWLFEAKQNINNFFKGRNYYG